MGKLPDGLLDPEPEPMIDTERSYCDECAAIQIADPMRHFKGCSHRVESDGEHLVRVATETFGEIESLRDLLRQSLEREHLLNLNLTSVQERCTQLLVEKRALQMANDMGIVLKGWKCKNPSCLVFNSDEKEPLTHCRSCGRPKFHRPSDEITSVTVRDMTVKLPMEITIGQTIKIGDTELAGEGVSFVGCGEIVTAEDGERSMRLWWEHVP